MAENYFTKFPLIEYDGKQVVDITKRINVRSGVRNSPFVFYPYEVPHELRPDHVASYYYEDGYLDWLIMLSNNLVDPYYDWYLTNNEFNTLIEQKYGTIEVAQRKVIHYQNNWELDSQDITPSFYNNTLPNDHKKYYTPVFGINTKIISYKRKADNNLTNTNRILQYDITSNNASNSLSVGELVNIRPDGSDEVVGKAQVNMANSTVLRLQSVFDDVDANTTFTKDVIGVESGANVTVNSSEIFFENFSNSEAVFWSPVTYYEYEIYKNETKKNINLVGDQVAPLLVNEIREQLNGNTTN